jgi:hypothetical protein
MAGLAYCGSCGGEIPATAKFCKHCGADQAPFKLEEQPAVPAQGEAQAGAVESPAPLAPPPQTETAASPPPAEPSPAQPTQPPTAEPAPSAPDAPAWPGAREGAERVAPGADELIGRLATHLQAPGVALAGLSALIGAGVCLAAGLVLAILLPNASFLAVGGGAGLFKETLAQAASFSQANLNIEGLSVSARTVPVLFVLFPILGVAAGAAAMAPRTAGMPARERLLWAGAAGVPFALLMLVISLSVGKVQFDLINSDVKLASGSVFLLSFLWGALGGVLGMLYAFRQASEPVPNPLPPAWARYTGIAWSALRPLLLALVVVGALGTAIWIVQTVADSDYSDFPPRSTAIAVGEQVAYAGDHAIDILPLGAGASQRFAGSYPALPIDQGSYFELSGSGEEGVVPTYNLFDFSSTMPAYLFIPLLVGLIGIVALLALYAGFATARSAGETRAERSAAWGALVGPLWAIAMVLLAALARKTIVGDPTGDSVFVAFLLGGAVMGAVGGLLAAQGGAAPAPSQSAPPPPPGA